MELDDFNCPLCNCNYNMSSKIPRLLIHCGHTFCQECLKTKQEENNKKIECPEDKIVYDDIADVEYLPKNLIVINLIEKIEQRSRSNSVNTLSATRTPDKSMNKSRYSQECAESLNFISDSNCKASLFNNRSSLSNFTQLSRNAKEDYNMMSSSTECPESSNKKISPNSNQHLTICPSAFSNPTSEFKLTAEQRNNNTCLKHRRPLEIVCMDHQLRICTSCALFGDHKNHNLRSEEDIVKEVSIKAEILIEFYEIIEKTAEKIEMDNEHSKSSVNLIKENVKGKSDKMKEKIKTFFKELRFLLKTKEKALIEEIQENYDQNFDKRVALYETFQNDVRRKILNWRKEVQNLLDKLNEMNETHEIFFDFLDNKNELMSNAEHIIEEMEILKENTPLKEFSKFESAIEVDCNFELFNSNFNNLCQLTIKNPTSSNNLDSIGQEKNKINIVDFISPIPTETNTEDNQSMSKFHPMYANFVNAVNTIGSSTSLNNIHLENSFFSCEDFFNNKDITPTSKLGISLSTNLNSTVNTNKPLSSDKIVFIKNQLKNEIANFSGYSICDEGAKKIAELMLASQFSYSPSKRSTGVKVKEFKFTKSGIGDEGFSHLSNCLEKANSVHSINLNKNKLTDESYTYIVNLIKNNKQLKYLNLMANNFSQGIKEKIKSFSKNLNPALKLEL